MKTRVLFVALVCMLLGGCAHIHFDNITSKPISFTPDLGTDRPFETVRHVDSDYRRMWLVFYLIPIGNDGSDMVAQAAGGGDGMVNLRVKSQYDLIDVIVTNLTSGLFCTRKVNVRGDVIQFTGEPSVQSVKPRLPASLGMEGGSGPTTSEGLKCQACGFMNKAGAKYCGKCGAELKPPQPVFCSRCGQQNSPDTQYCIRCGAELLKPK